MDSRGLGQNYLNPSTTRPSLLIVDGLIFLVDSCKRLIPALRLRLFFMEHGGLATVNRLWFSLSARAVTQSLSGIVCVRISDEPD